MASDVSLRVIVRPLSISMLEEPLPVNVSHEPGEIALRLLGEMIGASDSFGRRTN